MRPEQLDFIFPFIVFGYGAIMTFVLNSSLMEIAETRIPIQLLNQFKAHRNLGVVCLVVGALWSLQNLWFG